MYLLKKQPCNEDFCKRCHHATMCQHCCCTVRKVWADFAVCDCGDAIAKLYMCDEKFSQIEGNDRNFCHIELSNRVSIVNLLTVWKRGRSRWAELMYSVFLEIRSQGIVWIEQAYILYTVDTVETPFILLHVA